MAVFVVDASVDRIECYTCKFNHKTQHEHPAKKLQNIPGARYQQHSPNGKHDKIQENVWYSASQEKKIFACAIEIAKFSGI